jgi:hypothetical protein
MYKGNLSMFIGCVINIKCITWELFRLGAHAYPIFWDHYAQTPQIKDNKQIPVTPITLVTNAGPISQSPTLWVTAL